MSFSNLIKSVSNMKLISKYVIMLLIPQQHWKERITYVKYFGVLIDSHFSWRPHITFVASKVSKTLGILSRLRHFIPANTLMNIYRSLILLYLSHGIVVWGQAAQSNLDKLLILQKRALILIQFAPYRSHAIPLFSRYNVLPINMLYFKFVCTTMHDVYNNKSPPNISSLFIQAGRVHNYRTRFSEAGSFHIKESRTSQFKNSFARVGARVWNSIPKDERLISKFNFKKTIHQKLLDILSSEDNYVSTPSLIDTFSKF